MLVPAPPPVALQDGICRLPDIFIKDKNDTFHMDSHTYSSFRLMGRVVQRDLMGSPTVVLDTITPAVSEKFIVSLSRPADLAWMAYRHALVGMHAMCAP